MRLITAMVALVAISGCTGSAAETTELPAETTTSLAAAPDVEPVEETTTTSFIPEGPSQSAEDALRDGVIAELAAMPFDDRVHQYPEHFGPTRVETSEGVWIISVPYAELEGVDPCELGDPTGVYGLDWICPFEYGEILLLDSATGEIQKAYPFAALEPRALAFTEDATYCIRQGDGAYPDSMLCRIDRATGDISVRVFPSDVDSMFDPSLDAWIHIPDTWTFEEPAGLVLFEEMVVGDGTVSITGHSGSAEVDPLTLELTLEG
jgi:hypothetical protein